MWILPVLVAGHGDFKPLAHLQINKRGVYVNHFVDPPLFAEGPIAAHGFCGLDMC